MRPNFFAATLACLNLFALSAQADLPLNQWRSLQPAGADNALGGYAIFVFPQADGSALMRSIWGNYYQRVGVDAPWQRVFPTVDGSPAAFLGAYNSHPTNPGVITALESGSAFDSLAVVRSLDGGLTWTSLWQDLAFVNLYNLAVAPSDANVLYLKRGETELRRTLDGGQTWEIRSTNPPFFSAEPLVDPENPDVLYAIDDLETFLRSDDGGQTFVAASSGLPTDQRITAIAVDYNISGTVYAVSGSAKTLFKSTDAGDTWTAIAVPADAFRSISVDPSDSARILLLTSNLNSRILESTDAGLTWQALPDGGLQQGSVIGLTLAADGSGLAYGFSGVSEIGSGGLTFANQGFNEFEFSDFRLRPGTEDQYYGSRLQGLAATNPAAPSWALRNADGLGRDVRAFSLDPTNPSHLLASNTALFESFNDGLSWQTLDAPIVTRAVSVGFSGVDPNVVHLADVDGMLYSADGGISWQRSTMIPSLTSTERTIVGSPHNASVAIMHLRTRGIWRTDDAGATWSRESLWDTTVNVAFDPLISGRVYAFGKPGPQSVLAVSDNNGLDWTLDFDLDVFDGDVEHMAVDARVPGRLYARTAGSLYAFNPRTQQWSRVLEAAPTQGILFNRQVINGLTASTHLAGRLYQSVGLLHDIQLDSDNDGVGDFEDNCILTANTPQRDTDSDGLGNACDADIAPNANDCVVNVLDLGTLRAAFFAVPGEANWNPDADFNGDGNINAIDLGIMRRDFFQRPGFGANPTECALVR